MMPLNGSGNPKAVGTFPTVVRVKKNMAYDQFSRKEKKTLSNNIIEPLVIDH